MCCTGSSSCGPAKLLEEPVLILLLLDAICMHAHCLAAGGASVAPTAAGMLSACILIAFVKLSFDLF